MIKKIFLFFVLFLFSSNNTVFAENKTKIKKPNVVSVGIYLNSVNYVDLKKGTAELDFYIWFKTKKNIKFIKNIEIINSSDLVITSEVKDFFNGEHYYSARYTLTAYQQFNFKKFPLDNQEIYFNLESAEDDINSIIFEINCSSYSKLIPLNEFSSIFFINKLSLNSKNGEINSLEN